MTKRSGGRKRKAGMNAQKSGQRQVPLVKMPTVRIESSPVQVHFFFEGSGKPVEFNGSIRLPSGETITWG